jgi:GWxTD domain-containing protein
MKKSIVVLALLFISIMVNAQDKKFNFEFDYAQFAFDSSSNYIEFYYSFGQESLLRTIQNADVHLKGDLHVVVLDSLTNKEVLNKVWKISYSPQDTSDLSNSLVGVIGFTLPSGKYELMVTGEDSLQSSFAKSSKDYLTVKPFIENNISMSDLQFASKILQDSPNKTSIFYKNTYEVVPMPTSVFGDNEPVLFYYLELYNLNDVHDEGPLKLSTLVYNSKEQMVYDKTKTIMSKVKSRVEVGAIPVNKLSTGSYTLIVALVDSEENYGMSSSKRFFVYNPSVKATDTLYNKSATEVLSTQFGVMSEEELDDLFDKCKYIATSSEIDQYKALKAIDGKRTFISQFWKVRDPNPSTPKNEFYQEYLDRIQHCNQTYSTLGKKGWKTDRGRIYLKYGKPSEIERFPNQQDTKPYEIWHYNEIEGGIIFVFADLTNFSDYQLIHSTARGELQDENWENKITTF